MVRIRIRVDHTTTLVPIEPLQIEIITRRNTAYEGAASSATIMRTFFPIAFFSIP